MKSVYLTFIYQLVPLGSLFWGAKHRHGKVVETNYLTNHTILICEWTCFYFWFLKAGVSQEPCCNLSPSL